MGDLFGFKTKRHLSPALSPNFIGGEGEWSRVGGGAFGWNDSTSYHDDVIFFAFAQQDIATKNELFNFYWKNDVFNRA